MYNSQLLVLFTLFLAATAIRTDYHDVQIAGSDYRYTFVESGIYTQSLELAATAPFDVLVIPANAWSNYTNHQVFTHYHDLGFTNTVYAKSLTQSVGFGAAVYITVYNRAVNTSIVVNGYVDVSPRVREAYTSFQWWIIGMMTAAVLFGVVLVVFIIRGCYAERNRSK